MHLRSALALAALCAMTATASRADGAKKEQRGKLELKSAGPLAFGPRGILFIGDPKGAAIFAVDTKDTGKEGGGDRVKAPVNVDDINQKIASLLGTAPDQVRIQDVAVNPASGKVYISVSRGRGPDAQPVVVRVDSGGKVGEFPLDSVTFSKAALPNPPEDQETSSGRGRQNNRDFAITDLAFIDGTVVVAGLSNEEFASNLRAFRIPLARSIAVRASRSSTAITAGSKRARQSAPSCRSSGAATRRSSPPTPARPWSAFPSRSCAQA